MKRYDYLVVGSGLYGAIFAHEAKVKGKSVLVVDKRPNIAGNVYTEKQEGINVLVSNNGTGFEMHCSRLCGDTYHGICKALHAAELVHTLPAGYFDLSGLWYAQCYHDYISFRFC